MADKSGMTQGIGGFSNERLPFPEARKIVHFWGLKSRKQYHEYINRNHPPRIPYSPEITYKNKGWKNWGNWLGNERLPFPKAREIVSSHKFGSIKGYFEYVRKNRLPKGIPKNPAETYKNKGWNGWGDFLGTNIIRRKAGTWPPFLKARKSARSFRFGGQREYKRHVKEIDLPPHPDETYEDKGWNGWKDFLGTKNQTKRDYKAVPFSKARKIVRSWGLKNVKQYHEYIMEKRPANIPFSPEVTYKTKGWKGYEDWLGTEWLPFTRTRAIVQSLRIESKDKYFEYVRKNRLPKGIPKNPAETYKNKGWNGWGDFLGTYRIADQVTGMTIDKVKELIRDLIKNKVIDEWSADERYHLLTSRGVLNLQSNRCAQLLNSLVIGPRTDEQRKALEDFANSEDDENIPDLGNELIPTLSTEQLAEMAEKEEHNNSLGNGNIQTPQKILSQTEHLESICQDTELMQFFVHHFVYKLWKSAFSEQDNGGKETTVNTVRSQGVTGKKFHDTVVENFIQEYDGMSSIEIPEGYSFPDPPRIMQKYTAFRIKKDPYFCNLSGTGAGKTLSAILASRVIDSKMTLVVCPNDVVEQWASAEGISITAIFPDSKVITGKPAFYTKYDEDIHQYLILNYDKFSQDDSQALILKLIKEKIDLVVLDEIQFVKRRNEEKNKESQRRHNLGILLTKARRRNRQLKVVGMSATPVINNLEEGKSLLQYVTAKMYEDLATRGTVQNAMSLHQKLSTISIREIPKYKSDILVHDDVEVYADKPHNIHARELKNNPLLIEQYLTEARIPEIIKRINDQTIIYTEYVTGIVQQLRKAIENAGFTCAELHWYSYDLDWKGSFIGKYRFLSRQDLYLWESRVFRRFVII